MDRRTDGHQTVKLRLMLDAASVINSETISRYCLFRGRASGVLPGGHVVQGPREEAVTGR